MQRALKAANDLATIGPEPRIRPGSRTTYPRMPARLNRLASPALPITTRWNITTQRGWLSTTSRGLLPGPGHQDTAS